MGGGGGWGIYRLEYEIEPLDHLQNNYSSIGTLDPEPQARIGFSIILVPTSQSSKRVTLYPFPYPQESQTCKHTHTQQKKKKEKEPQQAHEDTAKIKSQTAELEAKWGRRVNNRKNKGKKKLHVGQAHLLHWGTSMSSDSDRPSQRWASTASPHHDPSVHRCSSSSAFSWLDGRRTEVHRNKYIYIYI